MSREREGGIESEREKECERRGVRVADRVRGCAIGGLRGCAIEGRGVERGGGLRGYVKWCTGG